MERARKLVHWPVLLGVLTVGAMQHSAASATTANSYARPTTFPGLSGRLLVETDSKGHSVYRTVDLRSQLRLRPLRIRGFHPRWSPDGRRVAFEDGGIRVGRADGSHSRQIVRSGTAPAWSPDGSQLAFADRRGGIYTVRADGRGRRRVYDQGGSPEWSPDGRNIAIVVRRLSAVFVLDLATGEARRVTPPSEGRVCATYGSISWSPDGGELAVSSWASGCSEPLHGIGSVLGIKLDGTGVRVIAGDDRIDSEVSNPVWAPDGSRLAVFNDPGSYLPGGGPIRIEILGPSGELLRTLRVNGPPQSWEPVCSQRGSAKPDRIEGRPRADLACGLVGNDTITGGRGRDRLFGEDGNDRVFARDGEFDVVGCGAGRDSVVADRIDFVGRDCERVTRG